MKVLLAAINAKYIHSNLGIYSLKTYGEKMLKEWGLAEQAEISLAEYTINHQMEQILQDIYKRKPDVIGFSCYIWNISYVNINDTECVLTMTTEINIRRPGFEQFDKLHMFTADRF